MFRYLVAFGLVFLSSGFAFGLSGGGLVDDPWVIGSLPDFDEFAGDSGFWGGRVRLDVDIDLSGRTYSTAVIAPDQNMNGIPFTGVFEGNGYVISNLTIHYTNGYYNSLGLFGRIYGSVAEVRNLGLQNVNISGEYYSDFIGGGLCAYNDQGTITNCFTFGSISGGDYSSYLGGLVGKNFGGRISNCYANVLISGYEKLGGLCGVSSGAITNSFASGLISGYGNLGGLCGRNSSAITNCYATVSVNGWDYSLHLGGLCGSNFGTITNCYATGSVNGGDYSGYLGGLCGSNDNGTISNCYGTGSVAGGENSGYLGGLCGSKSGGTISSCFWDVERSELGMSGDDNYGATGKTTLQMQTASTFTNAGWDFDPDDGDEADWWMPIEVYPKLSFQEIAYTAPSEISLAVNKSGKIQIDVFSKAGEVLNWNISGYDSCGWIISVAPDKGSSTGPGDTITVTIDIDSTGLIVGDYTCQLILSANNGISFSVPFLLHVNLLSGSGTVDNPWLIQSLADFDVFAGDSSYWDDYVRLDVDIDLSGRTYSSAVIAPEEDVMPWDFDSIPFTGVFSGDGHVIRNLTIDTAGADICYLGLFGQIKGLGAMVKNLGMVNVDVTGGDDSYSLGGLCGRNDEGTISNCSATGGSIVGDGSVGGLCGSNGGTISHCYATGTVSGVSYVGGLVGSAGTWGVISNCTAYSNVTGATAGGLVGSNYGSLISGCSSEGIVTALCDEVDTVFVGGLVGNNQYSYENRAVMANCYSTCSVIADAGSYIIAGGLAGSASGVVSNCHASGSIDIVNCPEFVIGGLIGSSFATISNSYADCTVIANSDYFSDRNFVKVGGLVGHAVYAVEQCYSSSFVATDIYESYNVHIGGLVGLSRSTVNNSFWDTEASTLETSDGGEGKATTEMKQQGTFAGWDFVNGTADGEDDVWRICEEKDYPRLWWEPEIVVFTGGDQFYINSIPRSVSLDASGSCNASSYQWRQISGPSVLVKDSEQATATFEPTELGVYVFEIDASNGSENAMEQVTVYIEERYDSGTGTKDNPYVISTAEQMNEIGLHEVDWDKHFVLLQDISLEFYTGEQFNIIGPCVDWEFRNSPLNVPFSGVFDGRGYRISNYTYHSTEAYYVGVFGYVAGEIKNLSLIDVNVDIGTGWVAGSLAGLVVGGSISNCHAAGYITGDDEVGGLLGANDSGSIIYCSSSVSVVGNNKIDKFAGGLISYNSGIVSNCYATGDVTGAGIGGLFSGQWFGIAADCYATGTVTGNNHQGAPVGGLIGMHSRLSLTINCYATGTVSNRSMVNLGGLVGNVGGGTFSNCYWDTTTSGYGIMCGSDYAGVDAGCDDSFGKTTVEMMQQGTFAGWDFGVTWTIDEGVGYPKLRGPYAGDFDYDRDVDFADFIVFAEAWGSTADETDSWNHQCNLHAVDEVIDISDFGVFAEHWLVDLSLAGYWAMSESTGSTADDSSAYGRDGTLLNMDDGDWVEGKVGNALAFDGVDDIVRVFGYPGVGGVESRTVCAWIKTVDTEGEIIGWGATGVAGGRWVIRTEGDGYLRVEVGGGAIVGSTVVCDGGWHHLGVVLDNDGTPNVNEIRLYVDGVKDDLGWNESDQVVNTSLGPDVRIGVWKPGHRYFEGLIDEVRIYDRALSVEEIGALAE